MLEELVLLVRLQEIDNQLMELEADKGDLPEQIQQLSNEIERFKTEIEKMVLDSKEIEVQKKNQHRVIEEARERLKRSQGIIYSVKTTREYDAISAEIEQSKGQISSAEKQLVDFNTRIELLHKNLVVERERLKTVEADTLDRKAEMKERLEGSQEMELKLRNEREKIVIRLKKPVFAHYERIRSIRDGVGVSHLTDSACSYCFSMIPPQRQAEVRRLDDIILCEVCGCILVGDRN